MNCSTPLPYINAENYIFYVGKVYAVRKINIAIGGRGEIIMDERVIDFQNIFAHDCSCNLLLDMIESYKYIFSIQQQTKQKEMNPINQCSIAIFKAVVDEQCYT